MTNMSIVTRLWAVRHAHGLLCHSQLAEMLHHPHRLPRAVRRAPVARHSLELLAPLDWSHFPERDLSTQWCQPTVPYVPFVAAFLLKLDAGLTYMSALREHLVNHPVLTTALGFPLPRTFGAITDTVLNAHLPTSRHFARILRKMPNAALQWLLDDTVHLLQAELADVTPAFGQAISLDTKAILAWVKENNPKAYVTDRFNKEHQPAGDPDCKLGCKRKRNQRTTGEKPAASNDPPTPLSNPRSPKGVPVGEYYWGYASGVVATKIPGWAEVVLAELTQPFNASDASYFHPLMADTERRLGFRPRFGALDAGFDCWYVYEHFHRNGEPWQSAFAAVPWAKRGPKRTFDADGLPLCDAGLAMPLKHTYMARRTLVPHQKGRYACPLQYPERTADACPVDHKRWANGGCLTNLATSVGARLRHQIDRDSDLYHQIYDQRTATERINSQAKALGIERPKLRNQRAITNLNTLIYVLINLRALHRIRAKKARLAIAA